MKASFEHRVLDHYSVAPLVGIDAVTLVDAPGWVCWSFGAVIVEGRSLDGALEALTLALIETDGGLQLSPSGKTPLMRDSIFSIARHVDLGVAARL